jgi:hypothetical protein
MSQIVETNCKSFTAGEAIPRAARVKLSGGKVYVAGLAEKDIGTAETPAFAADNEIAVRLRSAVGTFKGIANGAVTQGVNLYTAALGKFSATATATSYLAATALETATADGDIIEMLRIAHGDTAAT